MLTQSGFLILLFCFGFAASTVTITEFAVPSAVKSGENAELQCQYKLDEEETSALYVKWWFTPLNNPDLRHPIYQKLGHNAPQVVNNGDISIQENNTIVLINLEPKESGTYECEVSNEGEARRKQLLIVYTPGSGPILNISTIHNGTYDTDFQVTCEAERAAPKPELMISVNGYQIEIQELTITDPVDGEYSVFANTTLEELEDGSNVRCELFYDDKSVSHEAYFTEEVYESGEAHSTTEGAATSEEVEAAETTTPLPDGSDSLRQWWVVLAAASIFQLLASTL